MSGYDHNNVFAKILRAELPCHKIYEDDHTFAFLDIMPQSYGHTLVLPKEPARVLSELSLASLQQTIAIVQKLAKPIQIAVNAPAYSIMQFNGSEAGQTVAHVHFHIIPRFVNQPLKIHNQQVTENAELLLLVEKILAQLAQ